MRDRLLDERAQAQLWLHICTLEALMEKVGGLFLGFGGFGENPGAPGVSQTLPGGDFPGIFGIFVTADAPRMIFLGFLGFRESQPPQALPVGFPPQSVARARRGRLRDRDQDRDPGDPPELGSEGRAEPWDGIRCSLASDSGERNSWRFWDQWGSWRAGKGIFGILEGREGVLWDERRGWRGGRGVFGILVG